MKRSNTKIQLVSNFIMLIYETNVWTKMK